MSRIGNKPVPIPSNVKVNINGNEISVAGPAGTLKRNFPHVVNFSVENNSVIVKRKSDENKAVHGTVRAIINNMVTGVAVPFEKKLEIQGVGYKAALAGKKLTIQAGYSHPIIFDIPADIDIVVDPKGLSIILKSANKEKLGLIASKIRISKGPDAYKGKGIRYAGEYIKKKPGKAAIGVGGVGAAGASAGGKK